MLRSVRIQHVPECVQQADGRELQCLSSSLALAEWLFNSLFALVTRPKWARVHGLTVVVGFQESVRRRCPTPEDPINNDHDINEPAFDVLSVVLTQRPTLETQILAS